MTSEKHSKYHSDQLIILQKMFFVDTLNIPEEIRKSPVIRDKVKKIKPMSSISRAYKDYNYRYFSFDLNFLILSYSDHFNYTSADLTYLSLEELTEIRDKPHYDLPNNGSQWNDMNAFTLYFSDRYIVLVAQSNSIYNKWMNYFECVRWLSTGKTILRRDRTEYTQQLMPLLQQSTLSQQQMNVPASQAPLQQEQSNNKQDENFRQNNPSYVPVPLNQTKIQLNSAQKKTMNRPLVEEKALEQYAVQYQPQRVLRAKEKLMQEQSPEKLLQNKHHLNMSIDQQPINNQEDQLNLEVQQESQKKIILSTNKPRGIEKQIEFQGFIPKNLKEKFDQFEQRPCSGQKQSESNLYQAQSQTIQQPLDKIEQQQNSVKIQENDTGVINNQQIKQQVTIRPNQSIREDQPLFLDTSVKSFQTYIKIVQPSIPSQTNRSQLINQPQETPKQSSILNFGPRRRMISLNASSIVECSPIKQTQPRRISQPRNIWQESDNDGYDIIKPNIISDNFTDKMEKQNHNQTIKPKENRLVTDNDFDEQEFMTQLLGIQKVQIQNTKQVSTQKQNTTFDQIVNEKIDSERGDQIKAKIIDNQMVQKSKPIIVPIFKVLEKQSPQKYDDWDDE